MGKYDGGSLLSRKEGLANAQNGVKSNPTQYYDDFRLNEFEFT
jgi:hypothetical protein